MPSPLSILQQYWKHQQFRPMQEEIIRSILEENDTLALLPTGGGKSICYQVPALMMDGLCLVISPLIALMQDQVNGLEQKGIPAVALHSGLAYYEVKKILQQATHGDFTFLYLSPERLETALFKEYLPAMNVSLVVVDEAHCVSQWGYDFRPPYLRIAQLREEVPGIPLIAVTASATPVVQEDILVQLKMHHPKVFRQSFERPNISYSSFCVDSKINKLQDILNNVPGSSIVYCSSRKQTKELAYLLNLQNIQADHYHAGLSQEQRTQKQEAWIQNRVRVMVCTNAFGMGIDKADVRSVIHYDIPDCLENYYQEAGRAGRDGKRSYAVQIYQPDGIDNLRSLPDKRFPPVPEIKRVYQALADYLQIPVGVGEGQYFDFDLLEFVKNFKLESMLVINTLKVLEQEGHITFSESIFLPSQVNFNTTRESIEQFEQSHPETENLIRCLLRTYEGIFDNRVSVHEKQLAWLCRLSIEEIQKQLLLLQSFGIIEYLPQKDTPQIHFLLNRAPAQYLQINQDRYLERKQQFIERVENMIRYILLPEQCRSRYISTYFGDTKSKDCGNCDNCLTRKRKAISPEEFLQIEQGIKQNAQAGIAVTLLIKQLGQFSKEKIWAVLDFLQTEEIIHIDEQEIIHLKP
ncbi:MAG: RecQ family ATP-dependent DNA helicase [Chitinophagaceae bacterium]|nr:RecQ family ATP-dependent DNA helicase [Chitinophagaceae bacterium]MCA6456250.1 RecQ family ATP-dependent DNA helicase [Chitinophagaceae bacterium]MCA6460277.1 RecQ family ATP-dependent DNA helicase [Chitinophagaceae bacterium]MCA6465164.1 RecQ family ATP-dependent DNA helicase [Chitinophagaceae bacterium]